MARIDLTQTVRQAVQTADSGVSANRDPSDDRNGPDFLQILKGRQKASDLQKQEEKLAKKGEPGDKESPVKRSSAAGEQASGQNPLEAANAGAEPVLKDLAFQLRVNPGQLAQEWDGAVTGTQDTTFCMPVQDLAVLKEAADELGQEAWQAQPDDTVSWPGSRTDVEQPVLEPAVSIAGQAENAYQVTGKEEMFPLPVTEEAGSNQEKSVTEQQVDGLAKTVQQESGQEQPVSDIHVKAQNQDRTGSNGQEKEELPLAHTGDSQPVITHQDAGTVGQAEAPGPVKTTMEELPDAFAKTLAGRMPEQNGTLTVEFEPASLGKVTLRIIYEAGRTSVSLMSDNPRTLEILSQNAGQIAGILEDKTGRETVIYTYQPQQQFADSREGGGEGRREPGEQRNDRRREQRDSFAQQLRLGLV